MYTYKYGGTRNDRYKHTNSCRMWSIWRTNGRANDIIWSRHWYSIKLDALVFFLMSLSVYRFAFTWCCCRKMLCELLNRFGLSFAHSFTPSTTIYFLCISSQSSHNPNAHSLHGTFYLWIVRLTFMLELFRFAIIQFWNFSVEWWWWCFRHYCLGLNIVVLFSQMAEKR